MQCASTGAAIDSRPSDASKSPGSCVLVRFFSEQGDSVVKILLVGLGMLAALGLATPLAAQTASIELDDVECFPRDDRTEPGVDEDKVGNGRVLATVRGLAGGGVARVFFRWIDDDHANFGDDHRHFYYVDLVTNGESPPPPAQGTRFWTLLPKPEDRNERVEYYAELLDARGDTIARYPEADGETINAPIEDDCRQPPLNEQEHGFRRALTVGEIDEHQENEEVHGFLCEGVVRRINFEGVPRADDRCNPCAVAWWIPLASVAPVFGISEPDEGPISPTRPAAAITN